MSTSLADRAEREEWFRLVVEAAPNAMVMVDRDRRIVLLNRGTERLFGYAREELVGHLLDELVPQRFRDRHAGHFERFYSSPAARAMGAGRDLYGRRKDGSEVEIEIGLNPIATRGGVLTLASIIDITDRRRNEAAIGTLAAIIESSFEAFVLITLFGVITTWNQAAERLFGYTADEAIGRPLLLIIPERLEDEEERILERLRRGESFDPFETVRRRKDGTEVAVSVRISPVRNGRGDLVGGSKIIRDITALKRRDEELRRSNAELEQFAYIASHDLQEPLRMVANYTELLAERYQGRLDEKADRFIHFASDGARRMQRLVADLLTYSRVGSQGKPLVDVSSEAVFASVVDLLSTLVQETGATIDHRPLPVVLADETQLSQLFQNLLGNALKFRSTKSPHVVVSAEREGNMWAFSVADNGIGLDMRWAERIFQMFQRLHEIGKYEGSGIGLALAKRIVERHHGRIWVESVVGAGATFHFTLPASSAS